MALKKNYLGEKQDKECVEHKMGLFRTKSEIYILIHLNSLLIMDQFTPILILNHTFLRFCYERSQHIDYCLLCKTPAVYI